MIFLLSSTGNIFFAKVQTLPKKQELTHNFYEKYSNHHNLAGVILSTEMIFQECRKYVPKNSGAKKTQIRGKN